ncbi:MAG: polysaccharide deacetylase family protein [Gammaproteobacteria bacterium]|nr:polysaccharide deacetylase family protein [Gammaproteobacteria bacterium]
MKNKLLILCYHGFETVDESDFRPKLFIKPSTFEQRLELISQYGYNVLPLEDALNRLATGQLPDNALAITIDDGFYSVLNIAAELLNRYEYPSTLYLTTYYVENNAPIFRLVVQYMFWKTAKHQINLNGCIWSEHGVVSIEDQAVREALMNECFNYGEIKCTEQQRVEICIQLGEILDVDYQAVCNDRMLSLLTIEEAKQLSKQNCTIQLHTHRHRFPLDSESAARKEIADNRRVLEKIVDYPVQHFCYPSGVWDKNQWPWLEKEQVKSATTCLSGLNKSFDEPYGLTRFLDGENISEIEFKAELFGFSELLRTARTVITRS